MALMNRILILLPILLLSFLVNAQMGFRNISYEKAVKKAAQENKLIFLQHESEQCDQCNETANKAFTDAKLMRAISQKFIAIKMGKDNSSRNAFDSIFGMKGRTGTLYIDKNGRLVHRSPIISSSSNYYFGELKIVEKKYAVLLQFDADSMSYFVRGKKDIQTLKRIIQTKSDLGQENDLLLVEYINLIPKDSVNVISTLQFIAKQAPVLDSKPDLMMRRADNFHSAWYAMPLNERVSINNRITNKSMRIAAREKDEEKAKRIASFARSVTNTVAAGANMYDWNMMSYYFETRNYDRYLPIAANYYDRQFAKINFQFISAIDSAKLASNEDYPVFLSARYDYANRMQNAAERFYRLDKENKYSTQSLGWAKRSIELNPEMDNKYLYARILYKSGKNEAAIRAIKEAITMAEKRAARETGYSADNVKSYSIALEKMKKGEPLNVADN